MIAGHKSGRFLFGQVLLGCALTLLLTYFAMVLASLDLAPKFVRYLLSPGSLLGMAFASGSGWGEYLGSFALITLTGNAIYHGIVAFCLLKRINWPKLPRNPRHRFWMER